MMLDHTYMWPDIADINVGKARVKCRVYLAIIGLSEILLLIFAGIFWYPSVKDEHWPLDFLSVGYEGLLLIVAQILVWRELAFTAAPSTSLLRHVGLSGLMTAFPFVLTLLLLSTRWQLASQQYAPLIAWQANWAGTAFAIVIVGGLLRWLVIARSRADGALKQFVAVVGGGVHAERLIHGLRQYCSATALLVGVFDDRTPESLERVRVAHLISGTVNDLITLSKTAEIDRIIVALPHAAERRIMDILGRLRQIPVEISLAPDHAAFAARALWPAEFDGIPATGIFSRPLKQRDQLLKTIFDRVVAFFAIVVTAPVMFVVAAVIKIDSPGRVLFVQERYGVGNKVIKVFKFRTMYSALTDHSGATQATRGDERVTHVGRILRRTSLDELPQLFNVLRGDMSLVGPRPLPIGMRIDDKLNHELLAEYVYRHRVKPGLTGWAQVNGHRGAISTKEALQKRLDYDLFYIDNWSFSLDMKILFGTLAACIGGESAF